MGGGSGGHVTPVVAVLAELKKRDTSHQVRFWCDKHFAPQAKQILARYDESVPFSTIISGKLRRYTHLSLWQHLIEPTVLLPNIIDMLKVLTGFVQAFIKLLLWRPDVIFLKGGYVCLPVGWAARVLGIPYVIHDSDAHPGLTNRLLAPHAKAIGTGAPLEYYRYPATKTTYVGIPIDSTFRTQLIDERRAHKKALGFSPDKPLTVVTGGGLGAKRINDAVANQLTNITKQSSVLLISGAAQYEELRWRLGEDTSDFRLVAFMTQGMADCLGAADVVVARAGATSLLELAAVGAPTVLVPNARLTGGHQVKNAKVYSDSGAVVVADEEQFENNPEILTKHIVSLLEDDERRENLRLSIHEFAKPQAASHMADIIAKAAKRQSKIR